MSDDKEKGGMKDNLRDEFDKATGKDKGKKGDKDKDKGSGGMKDSLRDEFDKATGKNKDKKDS